VNQIALCRLVLPHSDSDNEFASRSSATSDDACVYRSLVGDPYEPLVGSQWMPC